MPALFLDMTREMRSIPMKGRKLPIGKKGEFRGSLTSTRWSNG
ncbi:hypothetical protein ALO49_200112 [Pseudomonas savastanoi pv. retacarpa]|nr:hypothetical protein ALO49_200112 [Pseudomonas savastanoi pv. retacarpa]